MKSTGAGLLSFCTIANYSRWKTSLFAELEPLLKKRSHARELAF